MWISEPKRISGHNLIQHSDYVSFVMVLETGRCPLYIDLEDCLLSTAKQTHCATVNVQIYDFTTKYRKIINADFQHTKPYDTLCNHISHLYKCCLTTNNIFIHNTDSQRKFEKKYKINFMPTLCLLVAKHSLVLSHLQMQWLRIWGPMHIIKPGRNPRLRQRAFLSCSKQLYRWPFFFT